MKPKDSHDGVLYWLTNEHATYREATRSEVREWLGEPLYHDFDLGVLDVPVDRPLEEGIA